MSQALADPPLVKNLALHVVMGKSSKSNHIKSKRDTIIIIWLHFLSNLEAP